MANSILTISQITREAIRIWKNTNSFIQHIDRQYDDAFAQTGAKIGSSLRIRLPNDYVVRTGSVASPQDTTEQQATLTLATQKGVDFYFTSAERALSLDDFSKRVLAPAINNLVGAVANDVMQGAEAGICNYVAKTAANAVIAPTSAEWLMAGAYLDLQSAPRGNRKAVLDPLTMARTVQSLSGLMNPSAKISNQYDTGKIYEALGLDWFDDQTVIKHTATAYAGASTVNGANQTGLSVVVSAVAGGLAVGDIITFAGVNAVNRITKASTGQLRQFVVTSAVANNGTTINIYPAIVPASAGNPVAYQTVDASPANGAAVSLVTAASQVYRKNIVFAPEAVIMATADLEVPKNGVIEAHREVYDGISMRMISAYDVINDKFISRLDTLYGYLWVRPEWAVVVADAI